MTASAPTLLGNGNRFNDNITNTGAEPLVLFGNRSEGFGGQHVVADGKDRKKLERRGEG